MFAIENEAGKLGLRVLLNVIFVQVGTVLTSKIVPTTFVIGIVL